MGKRNPAAAFVRPVVAYNFVVAGIAGAPRPSRL
jgi:hypothetical protein